MIDLSKANAQLVARCMFSRATGKTKFEDYSKYYPSCEKKKHLLSFMDRLFLSSH